MCEFSGKLIAWIDRELPADEAAEVEKHLETCAGCRDDVDAYERASAEFSAYCDEVAAAEAHPGAPRWVPAAAVAGVAASLAALFLLWPRPRVEPVTQALQHTVSTEGPSLAASARFLVTPPNRKIREIHRGPTKPSVEAARFPQPPAPQHETAYLLPSEPVIQIAIPASEMLPPGAVPEGMNFVADLSIAADGSADGLRLRPRLAGF